MLGLKGLYSKLHGSRVADSSIKVQENKASQNIQKYKTIVNRFNESSVIIKISNCYTRLKSKPYYLYIILLPYFLSENMKLYLCSNKEYKTGKKSTEVDEEVRSRKDQEELNRAIHEKVLVIVFCFMLL